MDAMRASGLYDKAVLVVTADHGISFTPGTTLRETDAVRKSPAEIGWVPLFIKAPGQQAGRVDHRNWQQVDLLPTLADYAGVSVPWRIDGVSALRDARPSAEKPFYVDVGKKILLPTQRAAATVLAGPDQTPGLPDLPLRHLIGERVDTLPISATTVTAAAPSLPWSTARCPARCRPGVTWRSRSTAESAPWYRSFPRAEAPRGSSG
jgi:hypothetical protein